MWRRYSIVRLCWVIIHLSLRREHLGLVDKVRLGYDVDLFARETCGDAIVRLGYYIIYTFHYQENI